jgi:hypothetical protein
MWCWNAVADGHIAVWSTASAPSSGGCHLAGSRLAGRWRFHLICTSYQRTANPWLPTEWFATATDAADLTIDQLHHRAEAQAVQQLAAALLRHGVAMAKSATVSTLAVKVAAPGW